MKLKKRRSFCVLISAVFKLFKKTHGEGNPSPPLMKGLRGIFK